MAEWSVETCSPIISSNKCCADMKNWLIVHAVLINKELPTFRPKAVFPKRSHVRRYSVTSRRNWVQKILHCLNGVFMQLLGLLPLDCSWDVTAHGDAREWKWRGNWRMQWEASTLHTTSEHGVSSITTADAHTSAASSRLNWHTPADLNGLVRFAERRNLVSARVPSHFKPSLPTYARLSTIRRYGHPN